MLSIKRSSTIPSFVYCYPQNKTEHRTVLSGLDKPGFLVNFIYVSEDI